MDFTTAEQLYARIDTLCADGARRILGITGQPGAGKSTLSAQLLERFSERAVIVPMDGFHLANAELARLGRGGRKGAPDTFDSAGFVALLRRLRDADPAQIVYAPEFAREIEEAIAGAIAVRSQHRLIITEGIYLLLETYGWHHVRSLLDECWYIDVEENIRRERLVARHMRYGRDAVAAAAWEASTDQPNAVLIGQYRARADAWLDLK